MILGKGGRENFLCYSPQWVMAGKCVHAYEQHFIVVPNWSQH